MHIPGVHRHDKGQATFGAQLLGVDLTHGACDLCARLGCGVHNGRGLVLFGYRHRRVAAAKRRHAAECEQNCRHLFHIICSFHFYPRFTSACTVLADCFPPMLRQSHSPYISIMPVGLCLCLNENQLSQNCFAPDSRQMLHETCSSLTNMPEKRCQAYIPLATEGDFWRFTYSIIILYEKSTSTVLLNCVGGCDKISKKETDRSKNGQ